MGRREGLVEDIQGDIGATIMVSYGTSGTFLHAWRNYLHIPAAILRVHRVDSVAMPEQRGGV